MKNINKIIIFGLLVLSLSSCVLVNFQIPQPLDSQNEKAFPKVLQGTFISHDGDSIIINENSFHYGDQKGTDKLEGQLSDTILLRKDNNYYYLNLKNDSLWNIYIVKSINVNEFTILSIDANNTKKIDLLKKITNVKVVTNPDGKLDSYIVNPTKAEFYKMIEDSVFEDMAKCKRIGE